MYVKASQMKDNVYIRNLFYNKNIDMLFRDREYIFSKSDIGERLFRKMIIDSILFFDNDVLSSIAMRNPSEVLKDNLKNDYSAFINYVDDSLKEKSFPDYCYDSYDKAIDCGYEIYNNIRGVKDNNIFVKVRNKK